MMTNSEQWPLWRRTVLVTGGTGGIGYQTARALAQHGARVLITGREARPGEEAAAAIRRESGHDQVRLHHRVTQHEEPGAPQRRAGAIRRRLRTSRGVAVSPSGPAC